jgi:hypothetical protein
MGNPILWTSTKEIWRIQVINATFLSFLIACENISFVVLNPISFRGRSAAAVGYLIYQLLDLLIALL